MPTNEHVEYKKDFTDILAAELANLENIHGQDPDTGAGLEEKNIKTYLDQYTMRLFGSPFQLIDSVDKRFDSINPRIGNEYLRNFTLNSPVLHIKPGMPIYTGKDDGSTLLQSIQTAFIGTGSGNSKVKTFFEALAKNTLFSSGDKLQRRMYGFRETYYTYMSYVNYMCRSLATFLKLTNGEFECTSDGRYPTGTKLGNDSKITLFKTMDWSNYRWLASSKPMKPLEYAEKLKNATYLGAAVTNLVDDVKALFKNKDSFTSDAAKQYVDSMYGTEESSDTNIAKNIQNFVNNKVATLADQNETNQQRYETAGNTTLMDVMVDKVTSVMFMVQPTNFEEQLRNETTTSAIESTIDGLGSSVGKEIAWITNSDTDFGLIDNLADVLGDTVETAAGFLEKVTSHLTGGFLSNLFHGAIKSIKGQKMIYPEIYDKSTSEMNYTYTLDLSTPYGDDYNYYMEILVPLAHVICLTAPRMITSNSVASPFLVQSWMPGQVTCQLGIMQNVSIVKNPNSNRISVHGFPLDVKVQFTIRELYNALSISPINDPASFLFNETLNDYMANLGGLSPSVNTYQQQRIVAFQNFEDFFSSGEYLQDEANSIIEGFEKFWNPYVSSGG